MSFLYLYVYVSILRICSFQGTSDPTKIVESMGLSGLEPPTSRLSGVRSNQLSYKPIFQKLKAFEWS